MICPACRHARLLVRRSASSGSAAASALTPAARPFSQLAHSRLLHRSAVPPFFSAAAATAAARLFSTSPLRASAIESASPAPTSAPSTIPKPDFLNEAEAYIWDLLVAEFDPQELSVQDISGGCGSMYGIDISSEKFRGANMLKQQRMVNAALGDLVKSWHGVQLKTRAP